MEQVEREDAMFHEQNHVMEVLSKKVLKENLVYYSSNKALPGMVNIVNRKLR